MKFNISGFSQEKLIEYGLDANDALILRWLIDFAATGKMRKLIDGKNIYYQVFYEAIIEEFPLMGIKTTKSIAARFEKYVTAGLLLKKRGGNHSGGSLTLYALTENITAMMYENRDSQSNFSEKKLTSIRQNEENNNVVEPKNNEEVVECKPGDNDENVDFLEENTQKLQENNLKNNVSEKNDTTPNNENAEKKLTSLRQNEDFSEKKSTSSREEVNFQPKGSQLPFALNNPSLNSSINSSSKETEKEELTKVLGYYIDIRTFSDDFVPKLLKKLNELDLPLAEYQEYVDFAYEYCSKKVSDKSKLMAYIYSSFADNFLINQFFEKKNKDKAFLENINIKCPVCGTVHSKYSQCPECDLKNPKSETEKKVRSAIYYLSPENKIKLREELNILTENFDLRKSNQQKEQREYIYKKYINIKHEDFLKIFG